MEGKMLVAPTFNKNANYEEACPGVYFVNNWNPEFETKQIRAFNLRNYEEWNFEYCLPDGRWLGENMVYVIHQNNYCHYMTLKEMRGGFVYS
jgi:hypothetical protein